jgi:hypothetical protein
MTEKRREPSNTEQTVLVALLEGWRLRLLERSGWWLIQPNRVRPFARVAAGSIERLTRRGWLTPGAAPIGLGSCPAKQLTDAGRVAAEQIRKGDPGFQPIRLGPEPAGERGSAPGPDEGRLRRAA